MQVRWYERRSAVPAALAASMHEREVVASSLLDTNLVGCLDSRATVVRASSYKEVRLDFRYRVWISNVSCLACMSGLLWTAAQQPYRPSATSK